MGALMATLWNPSKDTSHKDDDSSRAGGGSVIHSLRDREEISNEQLVAETMSHATKNLLREQLYVCDLYKGLDERIPTPQEDSTDVEESLWRMNVDHPLVYVLVTQHGQQPIHVMDDEYGALVVYTNAQVKDGIAHLRTLCSKAGYEFLNVPESE